jgi:predicted NAD/FAD-binding protein/CRP-like cAMP-binding protein
MEIAVIGGGAAGMGAAWALAKAGFSVTIIEACPVLGGHCLGAEVPLADGKTISVDVGVSDFNRATFANVSALFDDLGLKYRPVCQDASFMHPDGSTAWYVNPQGIHPVEPFADQARFAAEIARFKLGCVEVLADPLLRDITLEAYLDLRGYSREFRDLYLYPRAQGSFPMPDAAPSSYQARGLIAFWRIHGIAGPGPADRNVLDGGMHSYPRAFAGWLTNHSGRVELGAEVIGVARRADGVRVRLVDAHNKNHTLRFEHVVFAVRSHQVVPLMEDAHEEEKRVFEGFLWQRARVAVHQDARLMPDRREAWGAYNYIVGDGTVPEIRPTITFYPNKLAHLPPEVPDVFVTMNPFREPDPAKVLLDKFFSHPAAGASTDLACARIEQIQGERNTWYCGSYLTRPWVHEQALSSGVALAEHMRHRLQGGRVTTHFPQADDFLHSFALFAGLDSFALADVHLAAKRFSAEAGETLFAQNDVADGAYLIATGEVQMSTRTLGDESVDLALIGPGGMLGEFSLIDGGRRSATATATKPAMGYFISRNRFEAMRHSGHPAAFEVMDRIRMEVARRSRAMIATIAESECHATNILREPSGTAAKIVHTHAKGLSDLVSTLPPFARLGAQEVATIIALCTRVEVKRGTILARSGDAPSHLFIVLRGAIRTGHERPGGIEQLAVHGPGYMAGLLGLVDRRGHPARLDVREDALLLAMEQHNFEALRKGYSDASFKIFDQIGLQMTPDLRALSRHPGRAHSLRAFNHRPEAEAETANV